MKKQSFVKGAFLLAVATGLGKIFSAIFKIPLDRLFLHAEGMAVFNGAYNIYMFFFAVATAGIPLAISTLIASSHTKSEEDTILSTSLLLTTTTLGASALFIFVFADLIALLTGMPESASAFRVMAPALIFCALTASFRGYFQGKMAMFPSALSQVADSFGRLFLGFTLAFLFTNSTMAYKCAGAISGVPFGAFLSAFILIFAYKFSKVKLNFTFSGKVLKKIIFLALPITLTASLHPIFNTIDTLSVVPFLKRISFPFAQSAFGCLSRSATLYALPVSIATAVASTILPAVAESSKKQDNFALTKDTSLAIRLALALSVPCAAGFIALPGDILNLLYSSASNYTTLAIIGFSAVFLSVGEVMACILQGLGKTRATVISALASVTAKIILNPLLMYFWGINGAAASTSISYGIFVIFLLAFILKLTTLKLSVAHLFIKPLICGFVCFIAAFVSHIWLNVIFSIFIAAVVYIPSIFITGLVSQGELNQIFSGHKIEGETLKNSV